MRGAASLKHPLIIGAGPAGCAAAIVLGQQGASPVLLDRDAKARDPLCGGFLSWRTVAQLRALGVDPVKLGGRRVDRVALFSRRGEAVVPLPAPAFGLSRHALDSAMRHQAISRGARLEIDAARGLEGTTVLGRSRTWSGDGLFLATGKHDLRGLARPRQARDPALGLRLRLAPSPERARLLAERIELHLFGRGYAGVVLQEDGSANLCFALRKSLLAHHGAEPAGLIAHLAERHPAFAERLGEDWLDRPIETIGAVPYGWIARATAPGLFRLGDQAAVIPSLAGEGIGIALASGAMAARIWLERGAAGAAAYQDRMAVLAERPVRIARLARQLAENPFAAALGVRLASRFPALVHALMEASRFESDGYLAQAPAAP